MDGVGAVVLPVPPVAAVYHKRLPGVVAVNDATVAFWQYVTGLVTVGAKGTGLIATVAVVEAVHPVASVTVTLYGPAVDTVIL